MTPSVDSVREQEIKVIKDSMMQALTQDYRSLSLTLVLLVANQLNPN